MIRPFGKIFSFCDEFEKLEESATVEIEYDEGNGYIYRQYTKEAILNG